MEKYTQGLDMRQFERIDPISDYNRNYYKGFNKDLLFAESDDDDTTYWYLVQGTRSDYLGISHTSEKDLLDTDRFDEGAKSQVVIIGSAFQGKVEYTEETVITDTKGKSFVVKDNRTTDPKDIPLTNVNFTVEEYFTPKPKRKPHERKSSREQ